MPFGWAWVPQTGRQISSPATQQAAATSQLAQGIRVVSGSVRYQLSPEAHYECTNAVLAYGQPGGIETTIRADQIDVYPDGTADIPPGTGFARGHVELVDPLGRISADDATFNWIDRTGQASNALIISQSVRVAAARIEIQPGLWTLEDVRAGLDSQHPIGYIIAKRATIRPGVGLVAYGVEADAFRRRLGGFHKFEYSIGGRFSGDKFPVPTYDGNEGFGVRFHPIYLADERTALSAQASVYQFAPPSYGVQLARSFLGPGEAHGLVVPRSELDMRFDFGYFDNVGIASPTNEHFQIGRPRDNFAVDSEYNVQAFDRKGNEVFAKPLEATYERSFSYYGFALITDNTVQQIHSLGGSDHDRFLDATSISAPMIRLSPTLTTRLRMDGATFQGNSSSFSWLHGQAGLVYRPNDTFRLGAAYVASRQFGQPLYLTDELYSQNGISIRSDFSFGPHSFSLLGKYDTDRGRWYDREIQVGQQIGPIEVFARYRTFPNQFIFGGMVRLDSVLNQLTEHNPRRPAPPPHLAD